MPSEPSAVLAAARAISKTHGRGDGAVAALVDVTTEIARGALTCIAGPSGSGKTTLLHCLSGLAVPDSGKVEFDGAELSALDDEGRTELRRRRMSFVFQRLNLLPALTVRENVALPLVMGGADREAAREGVAGALDRVGFAARGDAYPSELSGGELQRVAVARAVVSAPDVIWADEPTGALDTTAAGEILDLLAALVRNGTSVVVVSHNPEVAARADVVIRLRDGRIADR